MINKSVAAAKVDVPLSLSNQDIDDILTTAFEGGITYWCVSVDVVDDEWYGAKYASEVLSRGGQLVITEDNEDGTIATHLLTLPILVAGIKRYAELRKTTNIMDNLDAIEADCIIQLALFNEIVYG